MQMAPAARLFRLTCRVSTAKEFSSPLVDLEDLVAWLDQPAFTEACTDMFGYAVDDPLVTDHAAEIYDVWLSIRDDAAFGTLRLREIGMVDCFELPAFEITALEEDGAEHPLQCSMVQLVLWYAMGKIHALAQTHAPATPATPPVGQY
jgi:hypothetical protein